MRHGLIAWFLMLMVVATSWADVATTAPAPEFVVRVTEMGSGKAVEGAEVSWQMSPGGSGKAQSGADGVCRIARGAELKGMTVGVKKKGMVPMRWWWSGPSAEAPAAPGEVEIVMEEGKQIGGQVVDEKGKGVAGAWVYVNVSKKYAKSTQRVDLSYVGMMADGAGRWAFPGVPAEGATVSLAAVHPLHLEGDSFTLKEFTDQKALFAGTAELKVPTVGREIELTVLSPEGKPAAGAEVFCGMAQQSSDKLPTMKADAEGKLRMGWNSERPCTLTATLVGYGPGMVVVNAKDGQVACEVKLGVAREREMVVKGEDGKPLAGAEVRVWRWRRVETLEVELKTDEAGRVRWKDAPEDAVEVQVYAEGYANERATWEAGGVKVVRMRKPVVVTGRVVDAETGEAIPEFTITERVALREGDRMIWQRYDGGSGSAKKTVGKFSFWIGDSQYREAIRVQAPGYLPTDTPVFEMDGKAKAYELRLTKARNLEGRVVDAAGRGVGKAEVYMAVGDDQLHLWNGEVFYGECARVNADAEGRFSFPPQREHFLVMAIGEGGVAMARDDGWPSGGVLQLKPWAQVKGTATSQGKGLAEMLPGQTTTEAYRDDRPYVTVRYRVTPDKEGRFEMKRVMPGEFIVTREMTNHAPGRGWYPGVGKLMVEAGKVHEVAFGSGAAVKGRLEIPEGAKWMLREAMLVKAGEKPDDGWQNVLVEDDGGFVAEGLEPGRYGLRVALHEFPPENACGWGRVVGEYRAEVEVKKAGEVVDVGTVKAEARAAELAVGDGAPGFALKTLEGKEVRLEEMKGRWVLVDFWATWCAPCVEEMPAMKKVVEATGGRMEVVGISLDEREELLRRMVKSLGLTWPQCMVGPEAEVVKAYGATAIPATFLISPEGKVVAKGLRGEALMKKVSEVVGK